MQLIGCVKQTVGVRLVVQHDERGPAPIARTYSRAPPAGTRSRWAAGPGYLHDGLTSMWLAQTIRRQGESWACRGAIREYSILMMEETGSGSELALRRADAADAAPLAELYLRARRAAMPAVPPLVHTDDDVRGWIRDVVIPQHETWLAEQEGELVALLVLEGDYVDQLYVDPDRTGRGIGSALVRFAQDRRPNGLSLWTFQSNRGAQRFYERHGFVAVEYTDGRGNEEQTPDIRYVWAGHD